MRGASHELSLQGSIPQTWPTPPRYREEAAPGLAQGRGRPHPSGQWVRALAYLTGSRHRLNKLQQLAIRLNIPGLSSRYLPSEPRDGMGPELPGPPQGPHVLTLP